MGASRSHAAAAGNCLNVNGTNPLTYDADSEVKTVGGSTAFGLTYNANGDRTGETINGQPTTFTYDFDDQLTSITVGSGTISYRYDAIGRQVSKAVNGTLTGYYLDGNTILIEKTNGVNTAQYTWGDGLIRCNGEYPMDDGRGSVRFTTNASKTVTSSNAPNAFGVGSVTAGTASAFSWNAKSGYRQDGVAPTNLSSNYAFQKVGDRYYDPALMCFLTRDTELGQLPYTYCVGDPVNHTDPSGHDPGEAPLNKDRALAVVTIGLAIIAISLAMPLLPALAAVAVLDGAVGFGGLLVANIGAGAFIRNVVDDRKQKDPPDNKRGNGPPGSYSSPITYQDYTSIGGGVYAPVGGPYQGPPHNPMPFPSGSVDQSGQPLH